MASSRSEHITTCYKHLNDSTPLFFDAYLPSREQGRSSEDAGSPLIPAVIYFHGGGLTVGNRESWFPTWLQKRVLSLGYMFVCADYQLIPPSTGHHILKDIQDLFIFLSQNEVKGSRHTFRIDLNRIAVSGSSAGGLCAYLAAMHCSPKPKAVVSLYGMGGNFFTPHYLHPKNEIFFRRRELLDPSDFPEYIYPFKDLTPTSDSPLAYHPQTYHIPGYPANPRMLLARLYLQLGVFIDYYTGMHSPSLSETLCSILDAGHNSFEHAIPEQHRSLFPQLGIDGSWPPTIILHGTDDCAVPVDESRHLRSLLEGEGVPVELIECEGREHSFDYEPGAEDIFGEKFEAVKDFLRKYLEA